MLPRFQNKIFWRKMQLERGKSHLGFLRMKIPCCRFYSWRQSKVTAKARLLVSRKCSLHHIQQRPANRFHVCKIYDFFDLFENYRWRHLQFNSWPLDDLDTDNLGAAVLFICAIWRWRIFRWVDLLRLTESVWWSQHLAAQADLVPAHIQYSRRIHPGHYQMANNWLKWKVR